MIAGHGEGFGSRTLRHRRPAQRRVSASDHPEARVHLPEGFLYVSAVPLSGAAVRGIRVNEDSFTIQLRDAAGRYHSFRKSELKQPPPPGRGNSHAVL